MILTISTLITEFIYTENQKNLTHCYDQQTSILYNRNIDRITLTLSSTKNVNCSIFPRGIEAQIAFQTSGIPIQRISVTNYSYQNTTTLVFTNVPKINQEEFAVLNIYSYGYITEVPILIFREQKSSLAECFEESSIVDISVTELKVILKSTLLCNNQFNTLTHGTPPVIISELQSAELNIEGEIINLPVLVFQDEYQNGNIIEIVIPITAELSENLLLKIAPNATITFESSQGGNVVDFMHSVGNVTTTGWTTPETTFWHKDQLSQLGLYQNKYMLRLRLSKQFELIKPLIDATDFDNIMYVITGLAPNAGNAQQITVQTTTFNRQYRFLTFECDQGRKEDRDLCRNFFNIARMVDVDTTIYLDIIFQKGTQYVHIEKSKVEIQAKEILFVVATIGPKKASLQLVSDQLFSIPSPLELTLTFTLLDNSNPIAFDAPSQSFAITKNISSYFEKIWFDCDKKCMNLMLSVKDKEDVYFQTEANLLPGVLFSGIAVNDDYRIVLGLVVGISAIIITVLLITTLIGIFLLMKQLKTKSKKDTFKKKI